MLRFSCSEEIPWTSTRNGLEVWLEWSVTQRWEPWKTCRVPKMFLLHEEEMRPEAELIGRQDLPVNELKLSLWGKSAARDDDRIPARAGRCVWSFEHKQALQSEASEVLAQLVLSWDRCTWGRVWMGHCEGRREPTSNPDSTQGQLWGPLHLTHQKDISMRDQPGKTTEEAGNPLTAKQIGTP